MTAAGSASPRYGGFRIALFALLVVNTAYYVLAGTIGKGLDATAWLVLLALFMLETGTPGVMDGRGATRVVRGVRLAAAAGICAAPIAYIVEQDWLDVANTLLWIAVVVMLEIEVRRPVAVARRHPWFVATAALLYSGLALLVCLWMWRGEWFEAYDALLWLMAFALIEMDLLRTTSRERVTSP